MIEMSGNNLKEYVLNSGIPLEASVLKKLSKYQLHDWGEIEYLREGKVFSTDMDLSTSFHVRMALGLYVNFIIECKYRGRNQNWFFFKFYQDSERDREFTRSEAKNLSSNGVFKTYLESQGFPFSECWFELTDLEVENIFDLPEVHKGIEVHEKGPNEKSIPEAVSQVSFASVYKHIENKEFLLEMMDALLGGEDDDWLEPIGEEKDIDPFDIDYELKTKKPEEEVVDLASLVVPIIVTTAQINVIDENVTLEEVESCDSISQLSRNVPGVCLLNNYPEKYHVFIEDWSKNKRPERSGSFKRWYNKLPERMQFRVDHPSFTDIPCMVYIINYQHLSKVFDKGYKKIKKMANSIEMGPFTKPRY